MQLYVCKYVYYCLKPLKTNKMEAAYFQGAGRPTQTQPGTRALGPAVRKCCYKPFFVLPKLSGKGDTAL